MRYMPTYIDALGYQALKVKRMKETRREFLREYAQREYHLMVEHYKSKKKAVGKKILGKLEKLKTQNLENILDDYFYKICYTFYERQMQIWCLLRIKYLKQSAIAATDRRFNFNHASGLFDDENSIVRQSIRQIYPIFFSEQESEDIISKTKKIKEKLQYVFKNTTEIAAVGDFKKHIMEQRKLYTGPEEQKKKPKKMMQDSDEETKD
mmetsp:Transcript_32815/g.43258  ORF Transcript_32815/g.43258 Transcript_32815/m.43258 type:complete len:208 (-) Transcript_32815:497-1120(-)